MEFKPNKYDVRIKGTSPVIWNRMKRELQLELNSLEKDKISEWEERNWKRKAEYDKLGSVIIPDEWFATALIIACKKTRMVPHFATSKNQTYTDYVSSFMVYGNGGKYSSDDLEYYGEYCGAQGKNSSTKVWRVRPMLREWDWSCEITDPAGRMKHDELKALIEYAGLFMGLGDNRIKKFGRFELLELKLDGN